MTLFSLHWTRDIFCSQHQDHRTQFTDNCVTGDCETLELRQPVYKTITETLVLMIKSHGWIWAVVAVDFLSPLPYRILVSLTFVPSSFLTYLCPSPIPPLAQPLCFPKWVIGRPAKPQPHPIRPLIFIGRFSSFPTRSLISVHAGTSRCFVSQVPSWNGGMVTLKPTHCPNQCK